MYIYSAQWVPNDQQPRGRLGLTLGSWGETIQMKMDRNVAQETCFERPTGRNLSMKLIVTFVYFCFKMFQTIWDINKSEMTSWDEGLVVWLPTEKLF